MALYRGSLRNLTGGSCRFYPSCSEYALDVLDNSNGLESLKLITIRVLKCHPWGPAGYDPAPLKGASIAKSE